MVAPLAQRLLTATVSVCLASLVLVAILIHWFSDSWGVATVLLFSPRWVWGIPLPLLMVWAVLLRRWRLAFVLVGGMAVLLFGVMGYELPSMRSAGSGSNHRVRVMTANLGGGQAPVPLEVLASAFESEHADVAAFQECVTSLEPLRERGWYTYNSYLQCVISRFPLRAVDVRDPRDMWKRGGAGLMARYELTGPHGPIYVVNLHLETVRPALAQAMHRLWRAGPALRENLAERRFESDVARAYVAATPSPVIVLGDFNMPVESAIYREFWSSFTNAFSECGRGFGYTKRTRWHGVRIDHVLLGPQWTCDRAWVGNVVTPVNDHAPVVADVSLSGR